MHAVRFSGLSPGETRGGVSAGENRTDTIFRVPKPLVLLRRDYADLAAFHFTIYCQCNRPFSGPRPPKQ